MIDVMQFVVRDFAITRMHFTDAVRFITDYFTFRRQGMHHAEAVTNARNAF